MSKIKIVDPNKIKKFPCIVFVDDRKSWLSWSIKAHSGGLYNHVMLLHRKGFYASQNPGGYKEVPIDQYSKPQHFLKIYEIKDISDKKRKDFLVAINKDLNDVWYKRKYDYVGLAGQWLYSIFHWKILKKVNNPWTKYCSEQVATHLRKILGVRIPLHPSPVDLNKFLEKRPGRFECLGYWFSVKA